MKPRLPLDEVLPEAVARAGIVATPSELLTGDTAKGRIGDLKIYNSKVAFIVGRAGDGRGYVPYGGGVIDADLVRAVGEPGRSTFGEIVTTLDLAVLHPQTVEVVADGSGGGPAVVRATGREDAFPLFSVMLASLFGVQKHELVWSVDYILEPGAQALKIEHTLQNVGSENIEIGLVLNGYMFGDGARPFLPGYGFSFPATGVVVDYFAAIADEVSYLTGDLSEELSFIVTQSGISMAGSRGPIRIRPIEKVTFSQVIIVGDGDVAKGQSIWRALQGPNGAVAKVEGRVSTSDGASVAGAIVHAIEVSPRKEGVDYASQTRSAPDGSYAMSLPHGEYSLVATASGYPPSEAKPVSVSAGATVDFQIGSPGTIEYSIKDAAGAPLPAKISVRAGVGAERLPSRYGIRGEPSGVLFTEYAITGSGTILLPEGEYEVIVSRGLEYEIHEERVRVEPGGSHALAAILPRVVDTTGWMSTDTHIHSQLSPDSPDLFSFKVKAMVVEGLELPISTEHEAIGDFNPAIEALGLGAWMKGVIGSEVTTYAYGHFNAWPLLLDPELPGNGRIEWYFKKPAETFALIRARDQPVLQVNHPRSPSIGGYFSAMGLAAGRLEVTRTDQWSDDFDLIEVANGCPVSSIESETMPDWFAFLDAGMAKFAAGSTDSHKASTGEMGIPRTYVRMGSDDPRAASLDVFKAATRAGKQFVTCGPFVEISVGSAGMGEVAKLTGDLVEVKVKVQAPSWVDVDEVELVGRGGVVVKRAGVQASTNVLRFEGTLTASVSPGRDGWVIARVRGDRRHEVFARGSSSYAFTNPVLLDGDGDGKFGR
ncbi:MAG: carboxypeptidase regulatory-like domain-containing protein [Deltaproteobacteria bacterium]|nr:carboxypeptidase regulatory-like domain-containing protein [Deltaproteobacteria bacterium]